MEVEQTQLPEVFTVTPKRFQDERGWLSESYSQRAFEDLVAGVQFVQDNHSYSAKAQTLRGLHYQSPPHDQIKLVGCVKGSIIDVAVDARRGSPTYGESASVILSRENGKYLFIPKGFLHGFVTLEDGCDVVYKCSDFYAPQAEGGILWNSIGIDWGDVSDPILSEKDRDAISFQDWSSPFDFEAGA